MPTLAQTYTRPSDLIQPEDLSHVLGDGNYSRVYFTDGSWVMFGRSLKVFDTMYPYLIRISKSVAANPASITSWERVNAKMIRVTVAGEVYWVARRRVDTVLEQLAEIV